MKLAILRRFLLTLLLILLLAASSAQAMPLSEKASINRLMPYYLVVDMTSTSPPKKDWKLGWCFVEHHGFK